MFSSFLVGIIADISDCKDMNLFSWRKDIGGLNTGIIAILAKPNVKIPVAYSGQNG